MTSNLTMGLSALNLSNNSLDDKDIAQVSCLGQTRLSPFYVDSDMLSLLQLSNGIAAMPHGLVDLDLSHNLFTKKACVVTACASPRGGTRLTLVFAGLLVVNDSILEELAHGADVDTPRAKWLQDRIGRLELARVVVGW